MEGLGPLTLLPVVVAIGLALWTRQVVLSLLAGVVVASFLVVGPNPLATLVHVVDPLLLDAIADRDHVKVTLFSLFIAATVGIVTRGGGTRALVDLLAKVARTRRGATGTTWLAGMLVFFDDYANCLIVGNSMRPLADRMGVSREKLAYLVDSTAAPMATVALISTWVGYEVGLMDDALKAAGRTENAYAFFVEGLPYRFYPLFALGLCGMVAWSGRDFGPMRRFEAAARPQPLPPADPDVEAPATGLAALAIVPITALLAVTGVSLWLQGTAEAEPGAAIFEIIGNADGYDAMIHGSVASLALAWGLSLAIARVGPARATRAGLEGMGELFEALTVLFLAWALGSAIGELDAAGYLVGLLGDSVPAGVLPTLVFLLSAAIAFATGTSFGTMAVLMPLVIPLAFATIGPSGDLGIALASSAAVLSGATWGDHCSPISDTTVLSATGAGCDLATHVQTQLPYAFAAGVVSVVLGTLPAGFGISSWVLLPAGLAALGTILLLLGKPVPAQAA